MTDNDIMPYNDFIKLMKDRGYKLRENSPRDIYEISPGVKTFTVKKDSVGKFLEIECLSDTIISVCGKDHPGNGERTESSPEWPYRCNVKCLDKDNKEPFQESHQAIKLTATRGTVADIVITKILKKEVDHNDKKIQEWSKLVGPILKTIKSENIYEYPMWTGNYKTISKDFLNDSFNLYAGEKMIFYTVKPDVDIEKVTLEMKADILEKSSQITIDKKI